MMSYERYEVEDDHVTVGPWGGQNGARWDDGVFSSVRQVVISYGAGIDSILIEYDKKGSSVWSDKHGGRGGFKTNKVKFNYPEEFLVSVGGYYGGIIDYGPVLVRSLVFESNKRKYGPFGLQQGTHFSLPMAGGMIAGFHGRSSWFLESIGVHLKPLLIQNPPINLSSASQNYVSNEIPEKSRGFEMATTREKQDSIYQPEILIHKSGYSGSAILRGTTTTVVKSVTFLTNRRMHGPSGAGDEQGIFFSNNGIIAGLPARKGRFIDSIGPHFIEEKPPIPRPLNDSFNNMNGRKISQPFSDSFNTNENDRRTSQLWDDGIFSGVKKIFLFKGEAIYSIQIEYDRNGLSVVSARHGGGVEGSSHTIIFQYPLEVLTSFCGYYESLTGDEGANVIKSLTFFTNKGKYGPVGAESGTFFTSTKIEGKIVGFHGKSGCYLNAIGVHMQLHR
ncbi:Jacalin-related lectin 3 [Citrus sinensis]|nr:Jacalin-related lectin 3 [Citrus sinensis]